MDQVKIRASVAAHGLPKNAEVTVAATPLVEGAITSGVFRELERYPSVLAEEIDIELPVNDFGPDERAELERQMYNEEPAPKAKRPRG